MTDRETAPAPDLAAATAGFRTAPDLSDDLVRLRQLTGRDLPALLPMLHDPEVARLTGSNTPGDPQENDRIRAWYASRPDQQDRLDLAVVERASGAVVGEVVLNSWDPANASCNFRVGFVPDAHGRGLGTAATRLLLAHAFDELRLHRVSLEVYDFNPRARRVYEKVGFVVEGVLRDALCWEGTWVDATVMSVLAPEWRRHGGHPAGSALPG